MGIKGLYAEIGNGDRISLAKLANDKLITTGRPLRIAIDVSIWLFQIQAGQGGSNPEIRTLYYRLVRLLRLGIDPLFVFDGPNKPPFKRNAPTSSEIPIVTVTAKRLICLFGFRHHTAPGEAEAECALLQKLGVVDLVLSEDVDTLAFGCTLSIRNWKAESARGSKDPTHVNAFHADKIKSGKSGLDRPGMILVALMNGGDYIPEGIPGCGIKLACEAARAGFGHDLCEIASTDEQGFTAWRERLSHELLTNESGFFRTKHKSLKIPDTFPDRMVLGFHAHPVVSSAADVSQLEDKLSFKEQLDFKGLRMFVDEEFQWKHLSGAKKFMRHFAPAFLVHKLREQAIRYDGSTNLEEQTEREERLILQIMRQHTPFSTDGTPELKVLYIPSQVVDLDLDEERDVGNDEHLGMSSDEDELGPRDDVSKVTVSADPSTPSSEDPCFTGGARSAAKRESRLKSWDPEAPDKAWILESLVTLGAPLSVERWNASEEISRSAAAKKARQKEMSKSGGMKMGALDPFLRVTKPNIRKTLDVEMADQAAMVPYGSQQPSTFSKVGGPVLLERSGVPPHLFSATKLVAKPSKTAPVKKKPKQARKVMPELEPRSENPWTKSQRSTPMDAMAKTSLQSMSRNPKSSAVIRQSLEGTWRSADGFGDKQVTPERRISGVSAIDLTAD